MKSLKLRGLEESMQIMIWGCHEHIMVTKQWFTTNTLWNMISAMAQGYYLKYQLICMYPKLNVPGLCCVGITLSIWLPTLLCGFCNAMWIVVLSYLLFKPSFMSRHYSSFVRLRHPWNDGRRNKGHFWFDFLSLKYAFFLPCDGHAHQFRDTWGCPGCVDWPRNPSFGPLRPNNVVP